MTLPAISVSITFMSLENRFRVTPESVLTKKEYGARMTACKSCLCSFAELLGTVFTNITYEQSESLFPQVHPRCEYAEDRVVANNSSPPTSGARVRTQMFAPTTRTADAPKAK